MASNLADLMPLRATLRQRQERPVFCDGADFTRRLEAAYRAIWQSRQRWRTPKQLIERAICEERLRSSHGFAIRLKS
jgi:hypothetical protein